MTEPPHRSSHDDGRLPFGEDDDIRRALADSEARFRAIAAAIEDVIYITDLENDRLIYLSPAYERIWGRSVQELLDDLPGFIETIHPDHRAEFVAGKEAQARGERVETEYRIVRPDGTVRWIFDRSYPVAGASGRVSAGIASDVTARKAATSAIVESEALFRHFGDASSDLLWIRDVDTLRLVYASPAIESVYGVRLDQLDTFSDISAWVDAIVAADRPPVLAQLERVRRGERRVYEFRIRHRDGSERWIRNTDFPLLDARGKVQRIGGVSQDVTELKHAEAAVQTSEGRLRTLVERMPQLVWRSRDGGDWTWSSPQWQKFTGQTEAESVDLGWLDAVHPDDRASTMYAWEQVADTGGLDIEHRIRQASTGDWVWHRTRSTAVRDERSRLVEWLGTTTDVQELKALQERQSVLVAELQHRTRNLIAVVRSIADQTMATTGPTEAFRDQFEHRIRALARVQGLLSRAEEAPITIESLIRLELDALGLADAGRRVVLEGPEVRVRNSVVQTLALAVHELATNARKHGALAAAEGKLVVSWQVDRDESGSRRLLLDWIEEGGGRREVDRTTIDSGGYGRKLIERALPYSLGAKTRYAIGATGVHCSIDLPLDRTEPAREQDGLFRESR